MRHVQKYLANAAWAGRLRDLLARMFTDLLQEILVSGSGVGVAYDEATGEFTFSGAGGTAVIGASFDGGGAPIEVDTFCDIRVPFNCTITAVHLLADQVGSIVVDVWKDTYANFPPTNADSITAAAPPTLSSANRSADTTLTGWTTTITAGDVLRFNVESVSLIERLAVELTINKT
jgi:hypothetical protein